VKKALLATVLIALAAAAPAGAKGLLGAQLCGTDGCATERDGTLREGPGGPFSGAGEIVAPAKPGAFLRGSLLLGDGGKVFGRIAFFYVPGADLVVQPGDGSQTPAWWHPQGRFGAIVRSLAARLQPFPAPRITRVTVNGEPVADPQSYLRLYTVGDKATTYPKDTSSVQVVFESARQTPWTAGNDVSVYPVSRLLIRDGQLVSIPASVADRVAARASLAPGGGFPWPLAAAAALAVSALALVARRVRPRAAPQPVPQA